MKVVFWTDGFWPRTGGIETQGLQFIKRMQERGHEYRVFAQRDSLTHKEREVVEGISIRRFDFHHLQKNLTCLRTIREELQQLFKEFQPDIIHLYAASGLAVLAFLLIRQVFRAPIITTLHTPFFYAGPNPLLPQIILASTQVYCVSKWVLEETTKLVPLSTEKLQLIHNGLPLPSLIPTPLSLSVPVLLLLGRLAPEKGFDTALHAFSLLRKRGSQARLVIAGGGPERPFLESLVEQFELKDAVQFTGELSREEALCCINRATLVIIPSYFEPFGLVALEAMQMKRPVIASRVGGLQEIIQEGETGILVPPCEPVALSNAMETLLSNPDKAIWMGLNGYKRAISQFSLNKNVESYEQSIEQFLSRFMF